MGLKDLRSDLSYPGNIPRPFSQMNEEVNAGTSDLDLNPPSPNPPPNVPQFGDPITDNSGLNTTGLNLFEQRNYYELGFPSNLLFGGSFFDQLMGNFSSTGDFSGLLVNVLDFVSGRGAGGLLNRGIEGFLHGSNGLGLSNTFGIGGTTITNALGLSTPSLVPTTLNAEGSSFMNNLFNGGAEDPKGPQQHSQMIDKNPYSDLSAFWGYQGETPTEYTGDRSGLFHWPSTYQLTNAKTESIFTLDAFESELNPIPTFGGGQPVPYIEYKIGENVGVEGGGNDVKSSDLLDILLNRNPIEFFGEENHPTLNEPFQIAREKARSSFGLGDSKQDIRQRSIPFNIGGTRHNAIPLILREGGKPNILPLPFEERSPLYPMDESDLVGMDSDLDIPHGSFVRGGLNFTISRAAADQVRLGLFLQTGEGISFIQKQIALSKTSNLIQEENTLGDGTFPGTNNQFNNLQENNVQSSNLLETVFGVWQGTRFDKVGYGKSREDRTKYAFIAKETGNEIGIWTGPTNSPNGGTLPRGNRMLQLWAQNTLPIGDYGGIHFEYEGGPGSNYGVGKTIIYRYEQTVGGLDHQGHPRTMEKIKTFNYSENRGSVYDLPFKKGTILAGYIKTPIFSPSSRAVSKPRVVNSPLRRYKPTFKNIVGGARTLEKNTMDGSENATQMYMAGVAKQLVENTNLTIRREERIGAGDPGTPSFNKKRINGRLYYNRTTPGDVTVDKINALDIVNTDGNQFEDPRFNDMIPFRIEAVNSDFPNQAQTMAFRAFLDDYSDDYDANYNEYQYNGRGEPFFSYGGFKRTISFSFKISAQSRFEMMPLYRKLNYLVSQTAPDYKGNRMRANFVKVTIGHLVDRTPGIITKVGLKWQKDYPWEIALDDTINGTEDKNMLILPHVLDVNVNFTPIHSFMPQKGRFVNGELAELSPFILPSTINNPNLPVEKQWSKGASAVDLNNAYIDRTYERVTGIEFDRNTVSPDTFDPDESAYSENFKNIQTPRAERGGDYENGILVSTEGLSDYEKGQWAATQMLADYDGGEETYNGQKQISDENIKNWVSLHGGENYGTNDNGGYGALQAIENPGARVRVKVVGADIAPDGFGQLALVASPQQDLEQNTWIYVKTEVYEYGFCLIANLLYDAGGNASEGYQYVPLGSMTVDNLMNWIKLDPNDYTTGDTNLDPVYITKGEGGWNMMKTAEEFLKILDPLYPNITYTESIVTIPITLTGE